ncbi:hypothetical protein P4S72_24425 [Vibrio sp. PP-XX7]
MTFFRYMAQGLREIMAELGFRTIDEMVGQAGRLKVRDDIEHWKYSIWIWRRFYYGISTFWRWYLLPRHHKIMAWNMFWIDNYFKPLPLR